MSLHNSELENHKWTFLSRQTNQTGSKPSEAGLSRRGGTAQRSEVFARGRRPAAETERSGCRIRRGQANKSARGMPWHQEPMKDVISCEKLRLSLIHI